ncbi:PQQ-binding-like beta-propeller repeat protein [Telmatobacter sp. DSM 110680]|uniref:PQQ-binding-like beta-propeller repeat protein n=1 Tax=Telmatobacter sp. DSM 110680 TaxID=3036704 RepID=A0AAU7DDZ7_9BACT
MRAIYVRRISIGICIGLVLLSFPMIGQGPVFPKKTGVQTPGVQHPMEELPKAATIEVKGDPDWLSVTADALWITSGNVDHVVRIDPTTNQTGVVVTVHKPCSGLAVGFGSLWVPSCGDKILVRLDQQTGALQATVSAGPADDEGGVTAGSGSVWLVTSKEGELTRIDARTNKVIARIRIPAGSFNPLFADGSVWVSSNAGNALVRVDPTTNKVLSSTAVGLMPRFLTYGARSIWVLNQGDGTVSRVDSKTGKLIATIGVGIPGHGGEIAFGGGSVWATETEFPLSRIDAKTNTVVAQWHGAGGDSVRYAFGSVWLTDLRGEKVWRISVQ